MPARKTVCAWLNQHKEFRNQYLLARELQAEYFAEETLLIADNANDKTVQSAKLQIEARRWFVSKIAPKIFGDRVTQELVTECQECKRAEEAAKHIDQRIREVLKKPPHF